MRFVLGALLGAAGAFAISRRPPSGHRPPQSRYRGDQGASTAQRGAEPAAEHQPSRPALQATERQEQPDDGTSESRERRYRRYELTIGAVSVTATVVAAAGFAAAAYKAALDAVAATQQQVVVANQANAISTRALSAAVGASVHFGTPAIMGIPGQDGGPPKVMVHIPLTNDGGSTTKSLVVNLACAEYSAPPVDPFDLEALAKQRGRGYAIGSKDTIKPIACTYPQSEMARVSRDRRLLYAFGTATHRDNVEPATTHRVETCYLLHGIGYRPGGARTDALVRPCDKHNCTDEECGPETSTPAR